MPASKRSKRQIAIQRSQRRHRPDDPAMKPQPWHPLPDGDVRPFVPRNQRNATRDERGRVRNTEEVHDELRRLNP
uniref:Uncharacterized protein n=2 Tax=unclassified Mycobacterium TaxID=2642494 RepID=A1UJR4_MYCSK